MGAGAVGIWATVVGPAGTAGVYVLATAGLAVAVDAGAAAGVAAGVYDVRACGYVYWEAYGHAEYPCVPEKCTCAWACVWSPVWVVWAGYAICG